MGWYSQVSRDISKIPDAIAYFESELAMARQEVKLKGNVERAAAEMPGIVEHRFLQIDEESGVDQTPEQLIAKVAVLRKSPVFILAKKVAGGFIVSSDLSIGNQVIESFVAAPRGFAKAQHFYLLFFVFGD